MSFDVPEACTLPTAEQPLRLAEFDALFTEAVRRVETLSATHARLHLTGAAGLAARVRDLAARETECCSFFTFTTSRAEEAVLLDITVPPAHAEVLASLTQRAGDLAAGCIAASDGRVCVPGRRSGIPQWTSPAR